MRCLGVQRTRYEIVNNWDGVEHIIFLHPRKRPRVVLVLRTHPMTFGRAYRENRSAFTNIN